MICYHCMSPVTTSRCPRCGFDRSTYQAPPAALPPELVLHNTYLLGHVIGNGGFGITYIALDQAHGRLVAIKEYFPVAICTRDPAKSHAVQPYPASRTLYLNGVRKFYNEAAILAQLRDIPVIVQSYDFFYENNTAYIVMEYIHGITIEQHIKQQGPMDLSMALTVFFPVLRALDQVHQRGLLHRDISPRNILLDRGFRPRLIDFGASRAFSYEISSNMSVILNNGFAPIEQYTRNGRHGSWEDLYALSATMYYAFTGKIPPAAPSRLLDDKLQPVGALCPGFPDELDAILQKGMAVQYTDRYRTAAQMCEAIEAVLAPPAAAPAEPAPAAAAPAEPAPDSPTDSPAEAPPDKIPLPALLVAGVALFALVLIGLVTLLR